MIENQQLSQLMASLDAMEQANEQETREYRELATLAQGLLLSQKDTVDNLAPMLRILVKPGRQEA